MLVEYMLFGCLALLWGSSYLLIKVALVSIPPITLIAIRVSIAALFLLIVLWSRGERLPVDQLTWRKLFYQALLNSIGAWTVLAWGQQYVDSGLAGVLNSTAPIFVVIITATWTRHESVLGHKIAGAILGLCGVVLILGVDVLQGLGRELAGQLAVLLGAMLYAGAAIYGKQFTALSPVVTAAGTMVWATLVLIPLSLIFEQPWILSPSLTSLTAAVILAVFCTGFALIIYFRLVKTLGSLGVASQAYLRAGVSVLLGVFVLGEQMSWVIGIGLVTTLVGVAMINIRGTASN